MIFFIKSSASSSVFCFSETGLSLNKYYAFTVAELAITIGVIGVIAAITMPLAQRHFQGIELETANSKLQLFLAETLEKMNADNTYLLVTVTVPKQIENMSINLKAPIVINSDTMKGVQIIVEDDLPVKYMIYDLLKNKKEKAGE